MDYLLLVKKAIAEDSLVPLFRGEGEYAVGALSRLPADIPIDWAAVLNCIYICFREDGGARIPALCDAALCTLAEGDAFDVWCAFNLCFFDAYHAKEQDAAFPLPERTRAKVQAAVLARKNALRRARIWQGKNRIEGLWTDIIEMADVAAKKYGADLLGTVSLETALDEKLRQFAETLPARGGSVRRRDMDYPVLDAEVGDYALWTPCPARNTPSAAALAAFYGAPVSAELTEYLSLRRFAELELHYGAFPCDIFPLYENQQGALHPLPGIELRQCMYYAFGTARSENGAVTYALLLRSSGGIYLLEDGTHKPIYLTANLSRFFSDCEV